MYNKDNALTLSLLKGFIINDVEISNNGAYRLYLSSRDRNTSVMLKIEDNNGDLEFTPMLN